MINKMKSRTFLLISIVVLFMTIPLTAQLKRDGLIFSEVYLDENEPDKSWLEIYNPTSKPLILEKFRFFQVLSTNILPEEIQEKGGIEIPPNECIVLCANVAGFDFSMHEKSKLIQVSTITHFDKGGFFSLRTKGLGEDGVDIFLYGDPEETSKLKKKLGDFVVPFSKNSKSYSRKMTKGTAEKFKSEFYLTEPSPGKHSEEENFKSMERR